MLKIYKIINYLFKKVPMIVQSTLQMLPVPETSVTPLQWTARSHHQFFGRGCVSVGCHGAVNRTEMCIPQPTHDTIAAVVHTMSLSPQSVTSPKSAIFPCCNAHEISHLVFNPIWLQENERGFFFYFTASTFDPLILFSFSWMSLYMSLFLTTGLWYFPTLL